ncbi:Ig-like domain-containing protein, partial [Salinivibrio sp. HTSP]|uniref:Ig-like domain-containing protein n=1 Tax=Salinivibrio sp. HTSP TaxID=2115977 RepID=UPI000E324B0C
SGLADGDLTVTMNVTDEAGNSGSVTDTELLDTTAEITVNLADVNPSNVTAVLVYGNTMDVEVSQTVTLTVTDGTNTVSETMPLDALAADGSYGGTIDLSSLSDGALTVTAEVQDQAGNTATATDNVDMSATPNAPTLTLAEDTFATDVAGGDEDNITNNPTVSVGGLYMDGSWEYSLDGTTWVAGTGTTFDLPEGEYTAGQIRVRQTVAGKQSAEGQNQAAWDIDQTASVDSVALDLSTYNNPDATGTLTGTTTDVEAGRDVDIVITDSNGITVTQTATVQMDGSFEVESGDLSGLADGDLTVTATITDAAGNTSDPATASAVLDTQVLITVNITDANSLTLDDGQPEITGTTDAEPGQQVTLTITDSASPANVGIVTAVVQENGTYSFDFTSSSGLAEGELTVVATVKDLAGNQATATDTAILDYTPPNAPVVTIDDGDGFTAQSEIDTDGNVPVSMSLAGTNAVAGDTLTVSDGATVEEVELTQAMIDADKVDFASTFAAPAPYETLTVDATITDAVGNTSEEGTASSVVTGLLINGGFEDGPTSTPDRYNEGPGSGALPGWTIESGSIDRVSGDESSSYTSAEGEYFLDLNGGSPGKISQTVTLTVGETYTLQWAEDNFEFSDAPYEIAISGMPTEQKTAPSRGEGETGFVGVGESWVTRSIEFTAVEAETTISFQSKLAGSNGLALDAVTLYQSGVTEVAPIVLDLNQDGAIAYDTVEMDVNRDGEVESTAWAGAEDGVLMWDKHGDGSLSDLD